jgi:hypothetical protein
MTTEQQKTDLSKLGELLWLYVTRIWIFVLIAAIWILFISYVNTRSTTLEVQVTGNVSEVNFYKTSNEQTPVATVQTNGQDVNKTVVLRNGEGFSILMQTDPAQYYFVVKSDGQTYRSDVICCQVGISQNTQKLVISGLNQWELESP